MRLMVLGGDGMLGHQLIASLASTYEVFATFHHPEGVRNTPTDVPYKESETHSYFGVDAREWPNCVRVIRDARPDAIVNAIGIIKQRESQPDAIENIEVNALFPHRLAKLCVSVGAKCVHFSTDCVFSGRKGSYEETDVADPVDLYGRTKLLGEVGGRGVFTLRTSFVGLELGHQVSLIEWFLRQREEVRGYTRATYTGFTTLEMARIVARVLSAPDELGGVYQVSSHPISKFELLRQLNEALGGERKIEPYSAFFCDRSLISTRFRRLFDYEPPEWSAMIMELANQIRESRKSARNEQIASGE